MEKTLSESEKILESNKLIAEFMGAKQKWFLHNGYSSAFRVQEEMAVGLPVGQYQGSGYKQKAVKHYQRQRWQMHEGDDSGTDLEFMKYHSSWDWLMPVVQRIVNADMDTFDSYALWVSDSLRTADIKQVYAAVVNYIEQYNPRN